MTEPSAWDCPSPGEDREPNPREALIVLIREQLDDETAQRLLDVVRSLLHRRCTTLCSLLGGSWSWPF